MERISEKDFMAAVTGRKEGERLKFIEKEIWNMDLRGVDLRNMDFTLSSFQNTVLDGADFENSSVENALFDGCSVKEANFKNARLVTASFRHCDMRGCNIEGADLFGAVLESARLEGVVSDENTKWFRLHCPEKGAFLGYKKCVNDRMVQLLIPADAKRTSATLPSCRCSKAKVLTIKSFDFTQNFDEAWSLVDENFVYRKGEWVEVWDFNENRWQDSTTGIHFWMTRTEAEAY
ncbi:MAG: pentapeptide repeat-containing protein [Dorea sp.]|nr:pentapeptide repeat-containing protein [Dorea sp.]